MSAAENEFTVEVVPIKRRAYDPNNLHPLDEEARKYDDNSEGIDWDEIIASTQDDFEAGRFAFNSADYPTHEEAMEAFSEWLKEIFDRVLGEKDARQAAVSPRDATGF
jgi:hypothetical protein